MKSGNLVNIKIFALVILIFSSYLNSFCQTDPWQAQWIGLEHSPKDTNIWTCYRKEISLGVLPATAYIKIATDSKYWLYINNKLVIREGQLKRGPDPKSTYYDELNVSKYLTKGKNIIAVLTWYWGKNGFSHNNSGKSALIFESGDMNVVSNNTWKVSRHPAYYNVEAPSPNFRLAETNVGFDAQKDINWLAVNFSAENWKDATEFGQPPVNPWGDLLKRPIPFFKESNLLSYFNSAQIPKISTGDTIKCKLPYNAQVLPYFKINAPAGLKIQIMTDNYFVAGNKSFVSVRTDYITKQGVQEFTCPNWMNGHQVYYIIPKGVELSLIRYYETGYATELNGKFTCNDEFYNKLWQKAQRTLYLGMRDNYMDCPDRERALWWGDAALQFHEAFYALDTNATYLTKKSILNLLDWQKANGVLFSPVPSGAWDKELPQQMLASIYSLWNYYLYSGDIKTIQYAYPKVKKYLDLWKTGSDGLIIHRKGDWDWADWGEEIDMPILDNAWYVMALQTAINMAKVSKADPDVAGYEKKIVSVKNNFNKSFWNGTAYHSKNYKGKNDDRANAMSVLSGMADTTKFASIKKVLNTEMHASPYMEKFVLESFYLMNDPDGALNRMKTRYEKMVKSERSTLWELWDLDKNSTDNHGWAGGPLTLLSQYNAGLSPEKPGYNSFKLIPQTGNLNEIHTITKTVKGTITIDIKRTDNTFSIATQALVPGMIAIPKLIGTKRLANITVNGLSLWKMGKFNSGNPGKITFQEKENFYYFMAPGGKWSFEAF